MSDEPPLRWRVTEHAFPSAADLRRAAVGDASDGRPETIRLLDVPPGFDVAAAVEGELTASRRGDGWTAAKQRGFLAALAAGDGAERACRGVGMTRRSAHAFRPRAAGAAAASGGR